MDRRAELLRALESYREEHGFQPSLRELAELIGLRSVSSVHHHLRALEAEGVLVRSPGRARSLQLRTTPSHVKYMR